MCSATPRPLRLLLAGPPKIGKTTVVKQLVDQLQGAGVQVGGFLTHEVRGADRQRVGFKLRDLAGAEVWLAHQNFDTGVQVGRFGVDVATFEQLGLAALRKARNEAGVVIIDEIARMELASEAFVELVDDIFLGSLTIVATVHVYEHPVSDALKQRADIELVSVTEANRDGLPEQLFRRLTHPATPDG
ncbi:MAG: nucleoside-triphosphatase [Sciscionella sp.]